MEWAVWFAAFGIVVAGAGFAVWEATRRGRVRTRRRVLVNLDTGRTFSGVLWRKNGEWLVLKDAEMIERGNAPVAVDGEVLIERSRIEFVQAL